MKKISRGRGQGYIQNTKSTFYDDDDVAFFILSITPSINKNGGK
jgi:hypothetical protein